jgi:hypothetical protein
MKPVGAVGARLDAGTILLPSWSGRGRSNGLS